MFKQPRFLLLGILMGFLMPCMVLDATATYSRAGEWGYAEDRSIWDTTVGEVSLPAVITTTGSYVPMLTFNPGGGMNLYLYNPATNAIDIVKENNRMSWLLS